MFLNKWVISIAGIAAVALALWAPGAVRSASYIRESAECDATMKHEAEKLGCWLKVILEPVRNGDIEATFDVFTHVYDNFEVFGASGCHQHAHKVGDTAYYELFVARSLELDEMDFPQSTTACGYGFYHGFIEHLIQDHPDPAYVVETCEYLRTRLSGTMASIGTICYHASGHGFTVAKADSLKEGEWGDPVALVQEPLERCEALPTDETEVADCRQGVFNVITDWMVLKNLGLSYDYEQPFLYCDKLPKRWHYDCYYELGMKLGPVTGDDAVSAAEYVGRIKDQELKEVTYGVMIAGMMQRAAPLDQHESILKGCLTIEDERLFNVCLSSVENGMMEHGSPGKEYEKVLPLCLRPDVKERGAEERCYETLARRLSRFYPPERKREICDSYPEAYQGTCHETP